MFAVERTANIKINPLQQQEITYARWSGKQNAVQRPEGLVSLTLCPLSRKLKEKFLCDLCDSSEAGGESMSKQ